MDIPGSGAEGQVESEDYFLDLGVDTNIIDDEFDFKLDGVYGDVAQPHEEGANMGDPTDAANLEIGYEDEGQVDTFDNAQADKGTAENIVDEDVKDNAGEDVENATGEDAEMEYQDEIGYEEDETAAAVNGANQEIAIPEVDNAGISNEFTENQETYEEAEEIEGYTSIVNHEYSVFEDGSGENAFHEQVDGTEEGAEEGAGPHDEEPQVADVANDSSAHRSPTDRTNSASRPNDSQDMVTEQSPFTPIPDLIVSYNTGQYYLVGDPEDDPDSYFLSDESYLDEPLSVFLASIRSVISDEVSPEDELMIRINALGLEFGERSNQKFLTRSFRDILSCFAALASDPSKDVSQNAGSLQIELLVRRDSEARFLELLEETGVGSNAQQSGFSDNSEDPESASVSDAAYAEGDEEYDEELEDEYAEEYQLDGEDASASVSEVHATEEEQYVEYEVAEVETAVREDFETQGHFGGPGAATLTQLGSADAEGQGGDDVEYGDGEGGQQWGDPEADGQAGVGGGSTANHADAAETAESSANGNPPNFFDFGPTSTFLVSPSDSYLAELDGLNVEELAVALKKYGNEIDYSDDDEESMPPTPAQRGGKRKSEAFAEEAASSPKKRRVDDDEDSGTGEHDLGCEDQGFEPEEVWEEDVSCGSQTEWATVASFTEEVQKPMEPEDTARTPMSICTPWTLDVELDLKASSNSNAGEHISEALHELSLTSFALNVTSSSHSDTNVLSYPDVDTSSTYHGVPGTEEVTNGSGDAISATNGIDTNHDIEAQIAEANHIDAHSAELLDSRSKQTSRTSTINGDDVGPTQVIEGDFPTVDGVQPEGEQHVEKDEIDWENEVDEPEQTATTPLSPSAFGKRGRVNDTDSLADEADHKRRRT